MHLHELSSGEKIVANAHGVMDVGDLSAMFNQGPIQGLNQGPCQDLSTANRYYQYPDDDDFPDDLPELTDNWDDHDYNHHPLIHPVMHHALHLANNYQMQMSVVTAIDDDDWDSDSGYDDI